MMVAVMVVYGMVAGWRRKVRTTRAGTATISFGQQVTSKPQTAARDTETRHMCAVVE